MKNSIFISKKSPDSGSGSPQMFTYLLTNNLGSCLRDQLSKFYQPECLRVCVCVFRALVCNVVDNMSHYTVTGI